MFNNKILLFFSAVAVVLVIVFFTFVGKSKKDLSPVINAIPIKACMIVETDDFSYLSNKVLKNSNLTNVISKLKFTNNFYNNLLFVDSLLKNNQFLKKFVNNKTIIISSHLIGENNLDFLFATSSVGGDSFKRKLKKTLSTIDGFVLEKKINFGGAEIIAQKFNNVELFYTFYEDYFLMSHSEILLQKSIKNINSGASYFSNSNFKTLYEKTVKKSDATIFLNYSNFFYSIKSIFKNSFKNKLNLMQNFADWSAYEITLKRKEVKFTGHTTLKHEMQYLKLFKDVNPQKSKAFSIIPAKMALFLSLNIGNGSNFKFKYQEYLGHIRMLNDHQIELAKFYKKYKVTEDKNSLYEITDNEIGLFYEDVYKNGKEYNLFGYVKYNKRSSASSFLDNLVNQYSKTKNVKFDKFISLYNVNDEEYKIYNLAEKELLKSFYGQLFNNVNTDYAALIDNFIVFAQTKQELTTLINNYEDDKTFRRKSQEYIFINNLSSQSNIFFYFDIFHSKNILSNILAEKYSKNLLNDIDILETLQGPAVQFISDSYPIYSTITYSLNSKKQPISETVWEVNLDTLIGSKPFIVLNHNNNEKEIVIQDVANKLYLIDKNGKIIWTRQLDEKIISKIYQIDFYKNDKLQLFFNTKNKIYCIDRKGNWLVGYPVKLKSEATNGVSVFDYDFNKNYRIFVATKNHKIYLYSKEGKLIDGWKFGKTKSDVTKAIKHFKNNDKDYITFRDKTQLYILNRKGEYRITPEANVTLSKNTEIYFVKDNPLGKAHFSVTNITGSIYSIFENGKITKTKIKPFTNNHYYMYKDINGDKIPDYIFTDKNQTEVYNGRNNKNIYSYSYDDEITNDLTFYLFSKNDVRIGTGSKEKIYLINNKGHLCKGFPLVGTGLFSVGVFDENNEYSLIVGNKDNYLYKYSIK